MAPLILTLQLNKLAFQHLDALRQLHFPTDRNFIAAHITLFHALPGEQLATIETDLATVCKNLKPFDLLLPDLRFLGNGVAINVRCDNFMLLKNQLADKWQAWLTNQDKHKTKPHVTIQNKVSSEQARELYETLNAEWQEIQAQSNGVTLWHYRNGPWEFIKDINFG